MYEKLFILIILIFRISPFSVSAQNKVSSKKLIEFGWDYPNVSFLKAHLGEMTKKPFDGVVFSFDFDIYNAFDTIQRADSVFQYKELSRLKWKKFTDNFLFMRGASITGAHWLDDESWLKIEQNLKKVSKALSVSKAKGIGFDPEYYYNDSTLNPWVYRASYYHDLSYEQVGSYVRKRGKQFIKALQADKPDIKILCFWLLDLFDAQSRTQPATETGMALYPFFIEGIMEGINHVNSIIDGNESSYWFQKPENFILAGEYLRDRGRDLVYAPLKPKFKDISVAQSVYYDWIYAKIPAYDKGFKQATKDRYLRDNLYSALKSSDEYVWLYNERINWWRDDTASGVEKVIANVRKKMLDDQRIKSPVISGNSTIFDFKEEKKNASYKGFRYSYNQSKNVLEIQLLNEDIKNLQVYKNSRLIVEIKYPAAKSTIDLNKKYDRKGNLIIVSTDGSKTTSVAYVN